MSLPGVALLMAGPRHRFVGELAAAIQEQTGRSGLEDYCKDGGSVSDVEIQNITVDAFEEDGDEIFGNFEIEFSETIYSGCRNVTFENRFAGIGSFRIDVQREEIHVTVDAQDAGERVAGDRDDDTWIDPVETRELKKRDELEEP